MCGIFVYLASSKQSELSLEELKTLNHTLYHRGPDEGGTYQEGQISLAMRRLSILDLKDGHQPMTSSDGRFVIVYNGEIYNFEQIRSDLLAKGYQFKTTCDTEVLLNAFIDQGVDCLQSLNGMFAFAIWDRAEEKLFVARDRLGIKPLYYATNAQGTMFSSELTPIYRSKRFETKYNYRSIADYLAYWYICEPNTIFEDVFQLPPGSYLTIHRGQHTVKKYWDMLAVEPLEISFPDAVARLDELLSDAVRLQLKGDVPVGTFLSGGIDSGIITNLASTHATQPLKSFSIGFKEKSYSELSEAQTAADFFNVELNSTQIEKVTPESLQKIFAAFDEPLGNASFIPMYYLAKEASKEIKVVLTGDGGDELFGGYPTYQAPYYQSAAQKLPRPLLNMFMNGVKKIPVSHKRISFDYRLKQLAQGIDLPYDRAHFVWRQITS